MVLCDNYRSFGCLQTPPNQTVRPQHSPASLAGGCSAGWDFTCRDLLQSPAFPQGSDCHTTTPGREMANLSPGKSREPRSSHSQGGTKPQTQHGSSQGKAGEHTWEVRGLCWNRLQTGISRRGYRRGLCRRWALKLCLVPLSPCPCVSLLPMQPEGGREMPSSCHSPSHPIPPRAQSFPAHSRHQSPLKVIFSLIRGEKNRHGVNPWASCLGNRIDVFLISS